MYIVFLVNILLAQFNLEWNGNNLVYIHRIGNNEIYFDIITDFDDVLEFLGINLRNKMLHNILTVKDHYELLENSLFMNISPFFNWRGELKEKKLEFLTNFQVMGLFRYKNKKNEIPHINDLPTFIDGFFDSNLVQLLNNEKFYICKNKDKFNGKLIINWTNETPGVMLADLKDSFDFFINKEFNTTLNNFLILHKHKEVKKIFLDWYSSLLIGNSSIEEMPF